MSDAPETAAESVPEASAPAPVGRTTPTPRRRSAPRRRSVAAPVVIPPRPRLPRAGKSVLNGVGVPVFGARQGSPATIDWSGLAQEFRPHAMRSFLRHRKWTYVLATTDRLMVTVAVCDGTVSGTAFCMITDLETGRVLADSSRPGATRPLVSVGDAPLDGLLATYRLPGTDYRISQEPGSGELRVRVRLRTTRESLPGLRNIPGLTRVPWVRELPTASANPWVDIDLTLEPTTAKPLTVVSQLDAEGGLLTSTVKTAAMNVWGSARVHGRDGGTYSLDGGTGGMDYSNGFLPRHTQWQWSYATGRLNDGRLFGINLVSQFSGLGDNAAENCAWLDGALIPLDSRVRVSFNRDDLRRPWTVRTVDGSVHLTFEPVGLHHENLNLGLLRSKFVQPTGFYSGHAMIDGERIVLDRMPGVIEDQDIIW